MAKPATTAEEFHTRFKAALMGAGSEYGSPDELGKYADDMWRSYWDEQAIHGETPEECAEADLSEWGQE